MVAEFASRPSSAAIADSLSQTKTEEQNSEALTKSAEHCQAVAELEALLENQSLPDDSHQDFWAAFQVMMDSLDRGTDAALTDVAPIGEASVDEVQDATAGTLLPFPKVTETVTDLTLVVSEPIDQEQANCSDLRDRSFAMGQLLPFRARSEEPLVDPTPTWNEVMVVVGQDIQRIRESQGLSLDQIRLKTQVPVYHLQSLESGAVDKLPEEIFVRGFLRRICGQLGEEGEALLSMLPKPKQEPQEILADWQRPGASLDDSQLVHLRSAHLYVGYATLLAGAAGGLAWSFQETAQVTPVQGNPQPEVQASAKQVKINPAHRAAQLAFGMDVAGPEQMSPELMP